MTTKKFVLAGAGIVATWVLFDASCASVYRQGGRVEGRVAHVSEYGVVRPLAGAVVRVVRDDRILALARETACEDYKRRSDSARSAVVTWSIDRLTDGRIAHLDMRAHDREQRRRDNIARDFGDSLGLAAEQAIKAAYRAGTVATTRTDSEGRFSLEAPVSGTYRVVVGGWPRGFAYRWDETVFLSGGSVTTLTLSNDRRAQDFGFCGVILSERNAPDVE